ncbi:UvrD-like helicase [Fadolivirus algeromassiliense]|jgi:DNA polymerase III delta prime subunit|uniref:UvrD-like helicase n=1 Tax=Fadolivirus FV1/VV64 TaxID=3070911 RepID=A0A7D3QUJ0_9VIRU|nr:UvrD-like helicase [Fadolivirus algeromassiliense]QKF94165.1 UvrD-like helicase [Fadolivirus FV1/VV64]
MMNLHDYFSNTKIIKKEDVDKKTNSTVELKKLHHKNFTSKMNKFVSNNLIEMTDYNFMINFLKTRGTIVDAQRFHTILKTVSNNPTIQQEDKDELNESCSILFKHLYDLFDNTVEDLNNVKTDKLIKDIENYNKNTFTFTDDQKNAIKNLCYFLYDNNMRTFGLYGYAGTGKTTTITKLIHYLLYKNYINSIVFTAPTNKAVNVIKSKFRTDLDDLVRLKLKSTIENSESLDDILDKLEEKGFKVNFLTIHKLLNFQNDFDVEGERVFIKGDKASLDNYDLVIVDESSMIPFQIIMYLMEEAHRRNIVSTRIPKILFIGDPAQLPPVNEDISIIFAKNKDDFNFKMFQSIYLRGINKSISDELDKNLLEMMKIKFKALIDSVLTMKCVVLKQVMRSNDNQVIGICNEVRASVLNEIQVPKLGKFKGTKVFLYKYDRKMEKTNTEWFKKSIEYFKCKDEKQHLSNIILAWTNKQTDQYNDTIRKTLYGKEKLNKFEIGDILILTDFYNIKETEVDGNNNQNNKNKNKNKNEGKRFYTSEQIKVTDIEKVIRAITEFTEALPTKNRKIKNINDIEEKYIKIVKLINKNTIRKYNTWKLYVHKLADVMVDTIPETHQIYVVDDDSNEQLVSDRKFVAEKIRELRTYYKNLHKENLMTIDKEIIRPLWKELNKKLVDPFAKISYGASISVHKSQGSSFYNVFVDMDDILKNNRIEESKRCLYTAITRTSNELHLLI